ncbi:MAG: hypothetical protein MJY84_03340 [Bacteroidales bacterium]|nr:hypothetical protein [Bacteroidales bacterium]
MKKYLLALSALLTTVLLAVSCGEKDPTNDPDDPDQPEEPVTPEEPSEDEVYPVSAEVNPFTWIAIDDNGNQIDPDLKRYQSAAGRSSKQVGIFYFLWHGCHGYDVGANYNEVHAPTASDTKSPYDIQKLLDANPNNPALGGGGVMHHWGEPALGYYVANDEWVRRKHAQMLSDAGVDVVFFDVTNGYHYIPIVKQLAEVWLDIRKNGGKTPQIGFLLASQVDNTITTIYNEIYKKGLYKDLWYMWNMKPIILAPKESVTSKEILDFFTFRQSWFLNNNPAADEWFGDGIDKWPWGGLYPQQPGMHNKKVEFVSVLPATHPNAGIGRSTIPQVNNTPDKIDSGKGIYFQGQFKEALRQDPKMMFFTGWNEWTAQKQIAQRDNESYWLGRGDNFLVKKGDWYFVDQYNHEFSRDIEPLADDFGDNYYYMLVDYIRQFKGTLKLPTFKTTNEIAIDGSFDDWNSVEALYGDDKGDVTHRNHYGWGSVGTYTNDTGRNDIVLSKVANDGKNVYFYAECSSDITEYTDPQWMQLFLHVDGTTAWESFDYAINRTTPSETEAVLEKSEGGWKWASAGKVSYKVAGNKIEICVPLESIGITSADKFTVDFKWIDNAAGDGNIQTCMRDGDSAPNGRFRYRYKFSK